MQPPSLVPLLLLAQLAFVAATPGQIPFVNKPSRYFDVQAHRGGRGNIVENTLPAFAWALIDGSTTLELDNGITKDGVVVVWHDEDIVPRKCRDTKPAFEDDPDFPYVGKTLANLTLAQVKTLDCGSQRQIEFPLQLTFPLTKISTMKEIFDFVECADPQYDIRWNIESKIDPVFPNRTKSVGEFVQRQHQAFVDSPYRFQITYQSFDWRSLVVMKALDPMIATSALIDIETAVTPDNNTSSWLAGVRLDAFDGSFGEQVAAAAKSIGADILSPADVASLDVDDPTEPGYIPFTTRDMVDKAHELGMLVVPWTVNRLNVAERILDWNVDGIITDYPNMIRRLVQQRGRHHIAPKFPKKRVLECLRQHMELQNL
ncbi:glycerophosphoryl diester phosphodiesterase [Moniliophthora roreri MCA 2997]|uniref:Glycerophosphoryl diester phosphodiesterase n=2 Tax=Moniliophthora roreri TaxID=221103 RepID=V2Z2N9_MONRO|nr:glycerophosphoryl diester phosphodiesterase [Moniliophthora roreri MCA 2997]KAI3622636.1 glycerophosphoryl diester phosphodiesterase [Moniliophthora roreri]